MIPTAPKPPALQFMGKPVYLSESFEEWVRQVVRDEIESKQYAQPDAFASELLSRPPSAEGSIQESE